MSSSEAAERRPPRTSGTPEPGGGTLHAGGGTPDAGGGTPDAGGGILRAGGGTPDAGGGTPDTGGASSHPSGPSEEHPPGLRERKKARTRAAIQQAAMRLFTDRGYDGATVEEIAAAAEVSPSTLFRYFPTKEDLVLRDDYDEILIAALLAQPPELSPLQAVRRSLQQTTTLIEGLSPEEIELEKVRMSLTFTVPAVRARWVDELFRAFAIFGEAVARRAGRSPEDPRVRTFIGATFGVMLSALRPLMEDSSRLWTEFLPGIDEALDLLERGLPL